MISRIWHGWTTVDNADAYEKLLQTEIFEGIKNMKINGFEGIQLLRRSLENEVEFVTIMKFDSLQSVKEFSGEDYEVSVVSPKTRKLLSRFDEQSQHYEIKIEMLP